MKKAKFFLAGAFLSALIIGSITPFLGIGAVAVTAIDLTVSVVGGVFAVSQA